MNIYAKYIWSQLSDELFTEMDWDCDGVVTEEELITAFFRKVHPPSPSFLCSSSFSGAADLPAVQ